MPCLDFVTHNYDLGVVGIFLVIDDIQGGAWYESVYESINYM